MKTITVLLTKYSDWISWIVYHIGGRGYTHSSLGLENEDCFYSFNYHGFCVETLEKHKRRGIENCLVYELQIPEQDYERIKKRIHEVYCQREQYSYTRLGLALAVLKIPFKWKNHYFCSQFVAELLKEYGGVPLKKNINTYLPNHFYHELKNSCFLKKTCYNTL
ncbi:hypothetical protein MKC66_10975 [[Clostridium] innocuum]|nr:hypothetical protein [[Clostridium] innocuum]